MPTESRTTENGPAESFDEAVDVVVIGSGPAGSSYVRTILDAVPDARVLLVEAGPSVTVPPGLHMANIRDRGTRDRAQVAFQGPNQYPYPRLTHEQTATASHEVLDQSLVTRPGLFSIAPASGPNDFPAAQASAGVGGMGSHWFGACPRPYGSERIAVIDPEALDAAYDTAEQLLRVSSDQFTDLAMAERIRAGIGRVIDEGRPASRRVQQMPMALVRTDDGVRRSGPDVILGDLLDDDHGGSRGFELRPGTLARRIVMDGERAVAVIVEDRATGERSTIGARHVVVAADSVRTPQLLHASGIRPSALGRHLNEHPQVSLMAVMADGPGSAAEDPESGNTGVMSDPSAMAIASSGVSWIPFLEDRFPFHVQVTHVDPTSLGLDEAEIARIGPVISLAFFLPQELTADNRVEFSETETDWLGMPAPVFHYRHSDRDRVTIARAKATALTIAQSLGAPLKDEEPRVLPAGSSLHYQGTVRMGAADDGSSVCDPTSRVWGTENVRVAGNGVIPTSTACNPTLTSVALATLGAGAIVAELIDARAYASAR